MTLRKRAALTSVLISGLIGGLTALAVAQAPSQADAEAMNRKMEAMTSRALLSPVPAEPLRTTFTDRELNAYLAHHGAEQLPTGLKRLTINMLDVAKLETRSLVDLDAVRTSKPRTLLDPMGYITGSLEVVTVGLLTGSGGKGLYRHESASVGGVPIPRAVLQELLAFYSKSPDMPNGLSLDEPFELPASIREVQVRRGVATVVQ